MIWLGALFSRIGGKILTILAGAAGILALFWKVRHDGATQALAERKAKDATDRADAEHRMAEAPRLDDDRELVDRMRRGGF